MGNCASSFPNSVSLPPASLLLVNSCCCTWFSPTHDPQFALAHAGLAEAGFWLYSWWGSSPEELRQAEDASRRALELAPELAEVHVARGAALTLSRRYDEATHAQGAYGGESTKRRANQWGSSEVVVSAGEPLSRK